MTAAMREKLRGLLSAHSSNHEIALGFAVGVLVSFFPVYGPQLLICLLLVVIFKRLNRVAVFIGVQLSWLYPFMLYLDYRVGRLFMRGNRPQLRFADFSGKGIAQLWEIFKELLPVICVGSAVAGAVAAALTYALTMALLARYRNKPAPMGIR